MNHLKVLRIKKKMSQQCLADQLNLSQQAVYKYENHLSEPDIKTLKKLSEIFNTSIDYIVGNTDDPRRLDSYSETALTDHELCFLRYYRNLPDQRRQIIDSLLEDYNHDRLRE
ncbi:MAG: helix-turn-helix domain-containing protein [Lachnospiraceae bacterium]|nr:helix-turn-helix domain-containing protein [Lachnospiraceae bacterium]